jgi:glucokinase
MKQRRGVVALDVGGTKIACGLYLENGELLYRRSEATPQRSAESSVDCLSQMVEQAVEAAPRDVVVAAVGIVIPGWVNHRSKTVWAPNITGWEHIPLKTMLADRVPLPIVLDSDRSGYVCGESWLGVSRGLSDVVFLAVGTGIGAGILSGGKIVHGADDLAGAVGWMALNPVFGGLYARMGCFEAEASGNSAGRKGARRLGVPDLTSRELLSRAAAADELAVEVVNEIVLFLGMGVANLVSTLNPEMVVLGGGLFASDQLLAAVRNECGRWAQPFAAKNVRIELSALGEEAGLAGAARIAFDNI